MNNNKNPDHHIVLGFGFAFIFILAAKCVGALKEIAIAYSYGTDVPVGAYALSFNIANTPITLTAMVGNLILIPYFVKRNNGAASHSPLLFPVIVLIALVSSIATFVLLRYGMNLLDVDDRIRFAVSEQAPGMALMVISGVIATVISARLMASKRQINSLLEAIPSLIIIFGLIAFESDISANHLLSWLTCLGMFGYLCALALVDKTNVKQKPFQGGMSTLPTKNQLRKIAIIFSAQAIFVLGGVLLDQIAAASISYESNATLAYVNRILMLVTGLGATAVGRAVLPVLSEARLRGAGEELHLSRRWSGYLFICGITAAMVCFFLAPYVVKFLFERGEFNADDTKIVTDTLRIALLTVPLYFPALIISQSAVVQEKYALLLKANLLSVLVKVVIVYVFMDVFGLSAIIYAGLVRQIVSIFIMRNALISSK